MFEILCFFHDSIHINSCHTFLSIEDFKSKILIHWSIESQELITRKFFPLLSHYTENIDTFLDIKDILSNVFDEEPDIDYNAMIGPCRIIKDSALGVFIRVFVCEFEHFSFEKSCDLYDSFKSFVSKKKISNSSDISSGENQVIVSNGLKVTSEALPHLIGTSDNVLHLSPDPSLDDSSKLMFHINKAILFNDKFMAESLLHQYYDYNGPSTFNSLPQPASRFASSTNCTEKKIDSILSNIRSITDTFNYQSRHQSSLLSLSAMWMRHNCHSLAVNALEEGLKIAHQRDDHVSVAKALLLMYEEYKSEDLLLRCLDRCIALNQRHLASQASLLLTQHRSYKQITTSDPMTEGPIASSKLNSILQSINEPQIRDLDDWVRGYGYTPQTIWLLLLSSLYGDMKISAIIAKHHDMQELSQEIQLFSASSLSVAPNSKETQYRESCLNYDEYITSFIPIKKTMCKLWLRYGLYDMAIYEYQSLLQSACINHSSNTELMKICCELVETMMEKADVDIMISKNYSDDITVIDNLQQTVFDSTYDSCEAILSHLSKLFPSSLPCVFERSISFTRNYIQSIYYLHRNNISTSMKCVNQCLDLSDDTDSTENVWNEAHAKATILLARITEKVSVFDASILYENIERKCSSRGSLVLYKYQAMILRANIMTKNNLPLIVRRRELYLQALKASRAFGFPSIEYLINKEGLEDVLHHEKDL